MKKTITALAVAGLLTGCTARKSAETQPIDVNRPMSDNSNFFKQITAPAEFRSLKISNKIDVQIDKFVPTINGTFYIENNQKIWANLSALFISIARAQATPSGFQAYEKANRTYVDSDFGYLNNLLRVNFIDFRSLQNLLVGRTFIPVNPADYKVTQNAQGYTLTSTKPLTVTHDGQTERYQVTLNYGADLQLRQVNVDDERARNSLEISYDNWVDAEGVQLPKNINITVKGDKVQRINIENTRFEFTRMDTPFSIPANYKKTEIK